VTPRLKTGAFVLASLIFAFILRSALGHPMWVMTRGMVPTLFDGDLVWVSTRTAGLGDVVKVQFDSEPGVYRVVGMEGQQLEIANGLLMVDGQSVQEVDTEIATAPSADCTVGQVPTSRSQINGRGFRVVPGGQQSPVQVPRGHLYVLGDHRGVAGDSRPWGSIRSDQINGVVTRILWSWDSCETSPRWQRIGNSIE